VVDAPLVVGPAFVGTVLQSTAGAWTGNNPTFTRRWLRCNDEGVQCGVTSPVVTTSTYPVTAADLGYTFRIEVTAQVVDSFQARTKTVQSVPSAVVANQPVGPPDCTSLHAGVTKAQQKVATAQKALKAAKKSGKKAKIKKAQKNLSAAKAALKKAQAAAVAGGC
jgi:predicted hotdog family 3-hydroxylacyl-ACP dehydratase